MLSESDPEAVPHPPCTPNRSSPHCQHLGDLAGVARWGQGTCVALAGTEGRGCFTAGCKQTATTRFAPGELLPLIPLSVLGKLSASFCSEQQVKFPLCEHKAAKAENNENKVKKIKIRIPDGSFQARNSAEHSHTHRRSSVKHRLCWGRHLKGHFTSCLRSTTCFKIPRCLCWVFIPKSCFAYEFKVGFFGALR